MSQWNNNQQWGGQPQYQQPSYQPGYHMPAYGSPPQEQQPYPGPTPNYGEPYQADAPNYGNGDVKNPYEGDRFKPKKTINDPIFLVLFVAQVCFYLAPSKAVRRAELYAFNLSSSDSRRCLESPSRRG